ncbi:MAG: hypothetical protein WC683_17975 [bacterium]
MIDVAKIIPRFLRSRNRSAAVCCAAVIFTLAAAWCSIPGSDPEPVVVAEIAARASADERLAAWMLRQARLRFRAGEIAKAGDAALAAAFLDGCSERVEKFIADLEADLKEGSQEVTALSRDAKDAGDLLSSELMAQRAEQLKIFQEGLWRPCSD